MRFSCVIVIDMNNPLRIHKSDYNKIYFASDFHYNHQRDFLWKPRGFKSYQEHDNFIRSECKNLDRDDLLIFLGDYSLNTTDNQTYQLLVDTKATIFYIFGNHEGYHSRFYKNSLLKFMRSFYDASAIKNGVAHDHASLHGGYFNSYSKFQIFPFSVDKHSGEGFPGFNRPDKIKGIKSNPLVYFGEEGYFQIGNTNFFCRHMAPLIWDKMKYDNYVAVCGHSHGNLDIAKPNHYKSGKILDVGVDNALKHNGSAFFSVEEVVEIMSKKNIKIYDHHGDEHV